MLKSQKFLIAICVSAAIPLAATVFGHIRGVAHDPDHRPVAEAKVTLSSVSSEFRETAETDAGGGFEFSAVPVGSYRVSVAKEGFAPLEETFLVTSGSAPVLHFQLQLQASHSAVQVTEQAETVNPQSATPATVVSRSDIDRTPGADQSNSLRMITSFVPGAYMAHDMLHVRGGHGISWLIDGVPVPNSSIGSNVGVQFDPKDIDYLEVQRGGYSADYGDRTYGVFNIVPRSGFERDNEGELTTTYGSFHQTNDELTLGGHSQRFAWYVGLNGNRSDFGLATPGPDIIHDRASGLGGFGTLIYNWTPKDQLRLVTSIRRDDYQIPNAPDDQGAGVRDNERERDALANFSWVHEASAGVLLTVSPFYHFNRAQYLGGPNDPGISTGDSLDSQYGGAQVTLSAVTGRHNARIGVYGYGERDSHQFGLTANDGSGLALNQRNNPAGGLAALFLEDQFRLNQWVTLNGGVRLTHFGGPVSENAVDPRAGLALRIPRLNWVVRGFYGRYYQAPPLSTVAGALLDFAAGQGYGFTPLHGERDEENQIGIAIPMRGWTLDANHFHTKSRNYFDHDALGNSSLFLPLTIQGARIDGWEVTLQSPLLLRRGKMHLAYSHQRAEGWGDVTGGLTTFDGAQDLFLLDHDQQNTLSLGGNIDLHRGAWAAANLYYGSGFPDNGGPARLPAHTTLDVSMGKSLGERWTLSLQAINIANRRFLLDNSLTFGGTHYFEPRQIYAEVRYRFHF